MGVDLSQGLGSTPARYKVLAPPPGGTRLPADSRPCNSHQRRGGGSVTDPGGGTDFFCRYNVGVHIHASSAFHINYCACLCRVFLLSQVRAPMTPLAGARFRCSAHSAPEATEQRQRGWQQQLQRQKSTAAAAAAAARRARSGPVNRSRNQAAIVNDDSPPRWYREVRLFEAASAAQGFRRGHWQHYEAAAATCALTLKEIV